MRGLRYNYAHRARSRRPRREALEYYERLAKQDLDTAELALNYVRALYAAGRKKDAETVAEQAVQLWPGSTALHGALARMRWLRGEGENCTAVAEAELLWRRPSDLALRLACADALHRGGHPQKALRCARRSAALRARTPPALLSAARRRARRTRSPARRAEGAAPRRRTRARLAPAQRNLLSTLLRARPAEGGARASPARCATTSPTSNI